MFYTGYSSTTQKQVATYATSTSSTPDLTQWTRSGQELYWKSQSWETPTYGPNEPTVLIENGHYTVWYRGDAGGCSSPCSGPGSIGRLTIPRSATTKLPESLWSVSNATMTPPTVTSSTSPSYLYSTSYATADGVIEAQMKITSSYTNANLAGRIDVANTRDQAIGPAGTTTGLHLFQHTPSFSSVSSTSFAHGSVFNIYQLDLAGTSASGKAWTATSTEPGSAMVSGTMSSSASGAVGMYLNSSTADFDWFRVRKPTAAVSVSLGSVEP